jgi:hydrogenase nickel incorporation protein HypA/HybF
VQFYFTLVSKETMARDAKLVFKKVPVRFRCRNCGEEFAFQGEDWSCPACQSPGPEILTGREFFMESIEVE